MNKVTKIIIAVAIVILAVIAFNDRQNDGAASTIKIGSIAALTGAGSAIGEEERNGALLAIEEFNAKSDINGAKLELVSEDLSFDKIDKATSIAHKLINVDKVVAIIGAQWDEPAEPILPIIEQAQVPMVGADNSDQLEKNKNFEYFFSTWYDNRVGIEEILKYASENNLKNITVMKLVAGGFWEFTARIMAEKAPQYGVNIVDEIDLGNPMVLDFRTELVKANQKKSDAIFIVTSDYNQCTFLKQKVELGIKTLTIGTESSGDKSSLSNCSALMENNRIWSSPKESSAYTAFSERYEKRFGEKPKFPSASTAYDAATVIAEALVKTDGRGGKELRDAISATNIPGISLDRIKFNSKGFVETPANSFEMRTVKNGEVIKI